MKVLVHQRSSITRYEGTFSSLSAFLLSANPQKTVEEQSENVGEGSLFRGEAEEFSFTYREREGGASVSVCKRDGELTLRRGRSEMHFLLKKESCFSYFVDYGSIEMQAYTERIDVIEKGNSLLLTLVYFAVYSGMAQKNEVRFKIDIKEK